MKKKMLKKQGFSLIELALVFIIIGLLFGSIIASQSIIKASRFNKAKTLTKNSIVNSLDGLVLWLETTTDDSFIDSERTNGAFISTWKDINPQTKSPANATQSGAYTIKPNYILDGINELPAIEFDTSVDDFLTVSKTIGNLGMDSGDREFFVVFNDPTNFGTEVLIGTDIDNVHALLNSRPADLKFFNDDALLVLKNTISGNNYIANGRVYINGSAKGSVNNLSDNVSTGSTIYSSYTLNNYFYIGRTPQASPTYYFSGYIGEIIMFDRILFENERTEVKQYLSNKWGIDLS